jgi:diguanylate cyclase (GGDEF)-like protein
MSDKPRILVVDDSPANLVAMRRLLGRVDAQVVEAASGNEALAASLEHEFALVLLDVNMPEMDGFEVASYLSGEPKTKDTPIIFVTAAMVDDLHRIKGYSFGAVDYIAKPVNDTILLSKVRVFLDLYRGKQELRRLLAELNQRNEQLHGEIRERERAEAQVRHQATHDPLTGLPNRALFMDRLAHALEVSRRSGRAFALLYVDIDGFKPVNDTHGHQAGDRLLQAIAARMTERLRKSDTVARLGGDEFAVILEEAVDVPESAMRSANALCERLRAPYTIDGGLELNVGASIGVAVYPGSDGGPDPLEALIRAADGAMYQAKRAGKGRCVLAGAA